MVVLPNVKLAFVPETLTLLANTCGGPIGIEAPRPDGGISGAIQLTLSSPSGQLFADSDCEVPLALPLGLDQADTDFYFQGSEVGSSTLAGMVLINRLDGGARIPVENAFPNTMTLTVTEPPQADDPSDAGQTETEKLHADLGCGCGAVSAGLLGTLSLLAWVTLRYRRTPRRQHS